MDVVDQSVHKWCKIANGIAKSNENIDFWLSYKFFSIV
jgi:hypothetical protein